MAYIYDLTDTWNAGGTTFNAIKMNVTDSASAVSSKLVTLQTNGTEHFSVTKAGVGYVSGNLGVGTTIPSAKLEVARTDSAAGIRVTVGQGAYSGNVALFGVTGQSNGYYITKDAANNIQHIWDGTGGAERMRITSAGNVGIGTAAPGTKLDVVGPDNSGAQYRTSTRTIGIGSISGVNALYGGSGTELTFHIGSERMRIDSNGLVGIGTSAPTNKLTVAGAIDFSASAFSGSGTGIWSPLTNELGFVTAGSTRMRIDSSGNVGIGTAAPSSLGSNITTVDVSGAAGGAVRFQRTSATATSGYISALSGEFRVSVVDALPLTFFTTNTERARIDSSGNLLVGTTSAISSEKLSVIGSFGAYFKATGGAGNEPLNLWNTATSGTIYQISFRDGATAISRGSITTNGTNTAYNTSSDYRLKDIDGPIANSGAYIDALKPVQGSWKADGSRFIGLLAHEAQEVSETPIATGKKDGEEMQAMDYSAPEIIANLIAEIQSMRLRLAQLEGN